jgi:hypothetical protein
MPVQYACTLIVKHVEEEAFGEGIIGPQTCTMQERVNITAASFPELLTVIGARYSLDITSIRLPEPDEEGEPSGVAYVEFCRSEDSNGDFATVFEQRRWQSGLAKQWRATFHFLIEKRIPLGISREEIKSSGITIDE